MDSNITVSLVTETICTIKQEHNKTKLLDIMYDQ